MRDPSPAMLLSAVRRRLRLLHWARALRGAAWTTAALLISLALTHLWLVPLDATVVLAVAAMPWLLAAGWAISHRVTERECAHWADRHLGGASAFATLLETDLDRPPTPAVERFLQWIAAAAPRGLATLQSSPLRLRLTKPVLAMSVSAMLATTVLQLPSPRAAGAREQPAAATESSAARDENGRANDADAPGQGASTSLAANVDKRDTDGEESRTAGLSPLTDAEHAATAALELATTPAAGTAAASAAVGGREAGNSPDTVQASGLSNSWQGELAQKLLSSADAADPHSARADPSRAGAYVAAAGPSGAATATPDPGPAPAAAPVARPQAGLGPAEQAYLRAYFAGSGATP